MSELTIYQHLRAGGLSPAGACAVMGNMFQESAMLPNNVENRCTLMDSEYTSAVDEGRISPDKFVHDKFGYGLCQWTFWSRKAELWKMANARQVSIADEAMQCDLCLTELSRDFSALYQQLCSCTAEGMEKAVEKFCWKYENPDPAAAKLSERYQAALQFYATAVKIEHATAAANNCTGGGTEDACPINVGNVQEGEPYMDIGVPPLKNGCKGTAVAMLQAGLKAMGYYKGIFNHRIDGIFGDNTEKAVREMQAACNQPVTGIVDQGTWQIMFL